MRYTPLNVDGSKSNLTGGVSKKMVFIDPHQLDLKVDFPCGGCGRTFAATIRDLQPGMILNCPHCGWLMTMVDNLLQNILRWAVTAVDRHRDVIDKL